MKECKLTNDTDSECLDSTISTIQSMTFMNPEQALSRVEKYC